MIIKSRSQKFYVDKLNELSNAYRKKHKQERKNKKQARQAKKGRK